MKELEVEYADYVTNLLALRDALDLSDTVIDFMLYSRYIAVCRHSKIGEHKCCVEVTRPAFTAKRHISCDVCLESEIFALNALGIETVGSCCGHGVKQGYISVQSEEDCERMTVMGYERIPSVHECDYSFKPKTLLYLDELTKL